MGGVFRITTKYISRLVIAAQIIKIFSSLSLKAKEAVWRILKSFTRAIARCTCIRACAVLRDVTYLTLFSPFRIFPFHIKMGVLLTHSPYTKASLSSCTLCLPRNCRYKSACQIIHRFLLCQSDVTPPWLLEINKNRSSSRSNTYSITFFLVFVICNFKRFETRKFGAIPSQSIEYNWEPNSLPEKGI